MIHLLVWTMEVNICVHQKLQCYYKQQPRCPSADEWIRKLWYIYTMEYYSAIKKYI